jgi:hypothetical protein
MLLDGGAFVFLGIFVNTHGKSFIAREWEFDEEIFALEFLVVFGQHGESHPEK